MMQAIRCHAFGKVVEKQQPQQQQHDDNKNNEKKGGVKKLKKKFVPRKQPLQLKDVLSLDAVPSPTSGASLKPTEILIQTKYAGIQYPDYLQTQGLYQVKPNLPYIPGMDVTGIIVDVGNDVVKDFTIGDRVMVTLLEDGGTGGLCDYILLDTTRNEQFIYHVPDAIQNLAMVSNIGRNYFAAYHSIKTLGQINQDSIVLVDGASGGVGMACIELAKAMGCKCVIAGVSTQDKVKFPYSVGADVVFTYGRSKETYQKFKQDVLQCCKTKLDRRDGVDIVIDMVNGPLFEFALMGCVKPTTGKIVLVGFASGTQQLIKPGLVLVKEISVVGSLWGRYATNPKTKDQHTKNVYEILNDIATGKIVPRVNKIFRKQDFIKAFELYDTNTGCGNTVISFDNNDNDDDGNRQLQQQRNSKL